MRTSFFWVQKMITWSPAWIKRVVVRDMDFAIAGDGGPFVGMADDDRFVEITDYCGNGQRRAAREFRR